MEFFRQYIIKKRKKDRYNQSINLQGDYTCILNEKGSNNLMYILAGYKPQLWDAVFSRVRKIVPADFDVCILSSGRYVEKLEEIAKENKWSYIYSKDNIISNIQNYAINKFEKAEVIWKLDEDMFLTEGYFDILQETKIKAEKECDYEIGFVCPLVPINGYSFVKFLKKCKKLDEYEKRFGMAKIGSARETYSQSLWNKYTNAYMWSITGNIDQMARKINTGKKEYSICAGKYAIGAIMFTKEFWRNMGMFERDHFPCDGRDELTILNYCMESSKAIIVAEDCLVGHHSLSGCYEYVMEYMKNSEVEFY